MTFPPLDFDTYDAICKTFGWPQSFTSASGSKSGSNPSGPHGR
jgi:hypothetical protein